MEKSRAISPEIIGLFDKIIQQAEEYHKAFELLEKRMKEFDAAITKLNEMEAKITKDTESAISKINTNILESIILLKNKTEETFRLATDLGDVKAFKSEMEKLKDDLLQLHSNSSKFAEEMDKTLKFFKKKSELELETTLLGLKTKVEKEVANEAQKIELRLNMRLKQIEAIVVNLDEKLKSFEVNFSSVIKKLSLDIDIIKHGYSFNNNEYDDQSQNLVNQEISDRLTTLENMYNMLNEKIQTHTIGKFSPQSSHNDNSIQEIENKIASLSRKIDNLDKKLQDSQSNSAIIVAVLALVVALFALLLKFV